MLYFMTPTGIVYRMADDGSLAQRFDWSAKEWVNDPEIVRLRVTGGDIELVPRDVALAATKAD